MLKILPLNEYNVVEVAAIEKKCFGAERWSENLLREEIYDKNKYYAVCYSGKSVVGFGGYAQVLDEGHIMNIAVDPDYRNKGIGTYILKGLLNNGKKAGVSAFTLEVRVSNSIARLLYERAGFQFVGIRKKYYPDKEDACIYWLYM